MNPYVTIALTSACNLRCKYCPPLGETYLTSRAKFDFNNLLKVLDVAQEIGVKKVRFTGGEPLLYPHIRSAVIETISRGIEVHLNTNGVLLNKNLAWMEGLKNLKIKVSLDTLQGKTMLMLSGEDQVENILENILEAVKRNFNIRINTVVTTYNYKEVEAILSLCYRLGIDIKLLDVFVVPETELMWRNLYYPLKSLNLSGQPDQPYEYTAHYGIPTDEMIVNKTLKVRLKDSYNGTHYHEKICKSCPHFPCQEGLYCLVVTPSLTVIPCRLGEHLFMRCGTKDEIRSAILDVINIYNESTFENIFW